MLTAADARRRSFGLFCLLLSAVVAFWGQTVLKPHLEGLAYILYWLACIICVALAMISALFDIWVLRRRIRRYREDLARRTLREIELARKEHGVKSKEEAGGR